MFSSVILYIFLSACAVIEVLLAAPVRFLCVWFGGAAFTACCFRRAGFTAGPSSKAPLLLLAGSLE